MEHSGVIVDEATLAKLAAANGDPVPVCNAAGEVVGYYVTRAQVKQIRMERELEAIIGKRSVPDVPHIVDMQHQPG